MWWDYLDDRARIFRDDSAVHAHLEIVDQGDVLARPPDQRRNDLIFEQKIRLQHDDVVVDLDMIESDPQRMYVVGGEIIRVRYQRYLEMREFTGQVILDPIGQVTDHDEDLRD